MNLFRYTDLKENNRLFASGCIKKKVINHVSACCYSIQSELLSTPRLTVLEGSVEELLVTEPNPEEPGQHRVTGIRLGRGQITFYPTIMGLNKI